MGDGGSSARSTRVVGICGCTCAGKTTLSKVLMTRFGKDILYDVTHILQDDYFMDKEKVQRIPNKNDPSTPFYDYDSPSAERTRNDIVIVEGNLLTSIPEVMSLLDVAIFLTMDKETCRERRNKRIDYDPPDVDGYFDQVVWPAYEKSLVDAQPIEHVEIWPADRIDLHHYVMVRIMEAMNNFVYLQTDPISVDYCTEKVASNQCGASSLFVGTTRDDFEGRRVLRLEYEAYEPMTFLQLYKVCAETRKRYPGVSKICVVHRLGHCPVGEKSVVVATSGAHRQDPIEATEYIVKKIKQQDVPIFKKETYVENMSVWKENILTETLTRIV